MHLAIEYLVRKGLVKQWLDIPCSLFVQECGSTNKIAVTINEEFKPSQLYCVKHWHVSKCNPNQALPSFTEFRVHKTELFTHQAVVMPNYRLLPYHVCPIPFTENHTNHPMVGEMYNHYYDHYLNTFKHKEEKANWLWAEFVQKYTPQLCGKGVYIPVYKSGSEIAADQRSMVATLHPEIWQCWIKWCKHMLCLDSFPGELVFLGEYRKEQGGLWTGSKSPQSSQLLFTS